MSTSGPTSWWRAIATYPLTWAAIVLLAASVWLLLSWLDPPGALAIVLIVLAVAAAVAWPLTMSATGTLSELQFAVPRVEEVDPAALAALAAELRALDDEQPAEQLAALAQKRHTLARVLEQRLDAGELTYARYLATAQQVYVAALDNLHEVALAHQSVGSIDENYIKRRLAELDGDESDRDEGDAESVERERATLARRLELRVSQRSKIARLMAQNEAALTSLDRTTTALADVPIGKRPEDADAAMDALEELADRASMYADHSTSQTTSQPTDDPTKGIR